MSFHLLQVSPQKYAVIEADTGTAILSGVAVENCGHAKIIFGPVRSASQAINFLIGMTRKQPTKGAA